MVMLSMTSSNKNGRTLVYSCVDKEYAHWIPLYCLGMLYHNSNIDIEIGMEGYLCDDDRQAIEYLKKRFPNSEIKINENLFVREGKYALVDGIKCLFNTVRFITTPTIKNEYIYIGDVDIICLERNIFSKHVEVMKKENMCYSNIVRKNSNPPKLTGLHFSLYDCFYPHPSLEGIDMTTNDEEILAKMVMRKGITLNYSALWRPIHGIHFSQNRPSIKGTDKIPGWNADRYKHQWIEFINTEEYQFIINKTNKFIKEMIDRINKYFFPEIYSRINCIFVDNETANWHHQTGKYSFENEVHTITNSSPDKIYAAFPHLNDGSIFSTDFDFPLCFEFDIEDINTDRLQIQIYPPSANVLDITQYVSKGSHVTINVYSYGFEGIVDGVVTFIKVFPNRLTDKIRIGLQLTTGSISFSNFNVYTL